MSNNILSISFQKVRYFFYNLFPYKYNKRKYPETFLANSPKTKNVNLNNFPQKIFCFWTGNNPMTENRKSAFEKLKTNSKIDVLLINPENLSSYILKNYPLHPAFQYLSLVHKSDYLRCYFMHHYGGGYSDIKATVADWNSAFKELEKSDKWILGYSEISKNATVKLEGKLGKDLRHHYKKLIGNCAYIFRPKSPFTFEWYEELHRRMDFYSDKLKQHPGNVLGDNEGYPIRWTGILGDIFHPLCLKYNENIIHNNTIKPDIENYR